MISTAIQAADAQIKHMAPKPKSEKQDNHGVWQDRDIRFVSPLAQRVRGGLLSSLGGFVIRIRILMYRDVSCVYPEGYMYP